MVFQRKGTFFHSSPKNLSHHKKLYNFFLPNQKPTKNTNKKVMNEREREKAKQKIVIKIMNVPCLVEIYQIIRGFYYALLSFFPFTRFNCKTNKKEQKLWREIRLGVWILLRWWWGGWWGYAIMWPRLFSAVHWA